MPISGNIFKSADGAKREKTEFVGRFRSGYQVNDKPVALDAWRVTTGDPVIADAVAEVLSSDEHPTEWETKSGENFQVFGTLSEVPVLLVGAKASLVLWSKKGGKIRETDGEYLIEDGKVTDKRDPDADLSLEERKEMAKEGSGPEPSLQAYFRLADAPELGLFKFFSGSWTSLENFADAERTISAIKEDEGVEEVPGFLKLVRVEYTDKKTGKARSFVKPEIEITS